MKFKFHSPCAWACTFIRKETERYPLGQGKPRPVVIAGQFHKLQLGKVGSPPEMQSLDWLNRISQAQWRTSGFYFFTLVKLLGFLCACLDFNFVIKYRNYHLSRDREHPTVEPGGCSSSTTNLQQNDLMTMTMNDVIHCLRLLLIPHSHESRIKV